MPPDGDVPSKSSSSFRWMSWTSEKFRQAGSSVRTTCTSVVAFIERRTAWTSSTNGSPAHSTRYESTASPPCVHLALFAGDLGLEMQCESTSKAQTTDDATTLASWRRLLRRMLDAKPMMQIVLVGGNHDGLLCHDDRCLSCCHLRSRGYECHGATPSEAARSNLGLMLEGLPAWCSNHAHMGELRGYMERWGTVTHSIIATDQRTLILHMARRRHLVEAVKVAQAQLFLTRRKKTPSSAQPHSGSAQTAQLASAAASPSSTARRCAPSTSRNRFARSLT